MSSQSSSSLSIATFMFSKKLWTLTLLKHVIIMYYVSDIVLDTVNLNNSLDLEAAGQLVATGRNDTGQCNISTWKLF